MCAPPARNHTFLQKHRKPHAWIREQLSKSAHLPDPTHAGTKYPVQGNPSLRQNICMLFGTMAHEQKNAGIASATRVVRVAVSGGPTDWHKLCGQEQCKNRKSARTTRVASLTQAHMARRSSRFACSTNINSRLKGAVDRELGGKYIENKSEFLFFYIFAEKLIL